MMLRFSNNKLIYNNIEYTSLAYLWDCVDNKDFELQEKMSLGVQWNISEQRLLDYVILFN